jgi:hypothetical protein
MNFNNMDEIEVQEWIRLNMKGKTNTQGMKLMRQTKTYHMDEVTFMKFTHTNQIANISN